MQVNTLNKQAFVVAKDKGKPLNILGHSVTVKIDSKQAGGEYYSFEVRTPAGLGIPPHVHEAEDEIIRVIEGDFDIWIDGKTYKATQGSVFHFPRGIPHGFSNAGTSTGCTFWTVTPGRSFEAFFEELNALPAGPPDLANVAAIFSKYDINLLPEAGAPS